MPCQSCGAVLSLRYLPTGYCQNCYGTDDAPSTVNHPQELRAKQMAKKSKPKSKAKVKVKAKTAKARIQAEFSRDDARYAELTDIARELQAASVTAAHSPGGKHPEIIVRNQAYALDWAAHLVLNHRDAPTSTPTLLAAVR